jgi:hypothetical protein
VVPHWIGLDRARQEFEQLTDQEKQDSGGLVEPDLVADTVVTLALDGESVGRIVVIRADRKPYDVDPESPIRMSTGCPGERSANGTNACRRVLGRISGCAAYLLTIADRFAAIER